MLKFFESKELCHIILEPPLKATDTVALEERLSRNYLSWHIEFGRIYSLDIDVVSILYKEIFINAKQISITTHKNKLNHYLHKLGFSTTFDSLIKKDVVKINDVKIVLIGGSADSSTKIIEIVQNVNLTNLTLIIVQHVEADRVGIFDKILQKYTKHKVSYAQDGALIKKNSIYLAPNSRHLKVENARFILCDGEKYNYSKPSVSISYESFSNFYRDELLVIQECGYASDGVDKLELLKSNQSKLIIQNVDECKAKPMVRNAQSLHLHNYVLTLSDIIEYINLLAKSESRDKWVEFLLGMIYKRYNYDFRLYHNDMLNRRIDIFMLKHDIQNIKDAVGTILFNRSAFKAFFLEISINVTEFFRKPKSFNQTIEFLNRHYKRASNIKVWSAGCSSGEEAYSMAILLDSLGLLDKSIIYATDFNSVILQEAKIGAYSNETYLLAKNNFLEVDLETDLDDYLTKNDNFVTIDEKIKNKTLFFQHNLIEDSSFNEFDIIICKNVIIYFDVKLQLKVFKLFYDSLKFGGYLVLGESESVIEQFADKFEQCSADCKIFKKVF